jgi:hypothetical protein
MVSKTMDSSQMSSAQVLSIPNPGEIIHAVILHAVIRRDIGFLLEIAGSLVFQAFDFQAMVRKL